MSMLWKQVCFKQYANICVVPVKQTGKGTGRDASTIIMYYIKIHRKKMDAELGVIRVDSITAISEPTKALWPLLLYVYQLLSFQSIPSNNYTNFVETMDNTFMEKYWMVILNKSMYGQQWEPVVYELLEGSFGITCSHTRSIIIVFLVKKGAHLIIYTYNML